MNTQKLKDALDILTDLLSDAEKTTTVTLELNERELEALTNLARTNITVPQAVNAYNYHVSEEDVKKLLFKISAALMDY